MEPSIDQSQSHDPSPSPTPDPAAPSSVSVAPDGTVTAAAAAPTPDISPAAPAVATDVEGLDASDAIEHVDDDDISIVTTDPDAAAKSLIAHIGVPAARTLSDALVRQLETRPVPDADAPPAPPKLVQVETIAEGFDGTKFRTIGERFVIEERKLGKWMRRIEADVVAKVESL